MPRDARADNTLATCLLSSVQILDKAGQLSGEDKAVRDCRAAFATKYSTIAMYNTERND
jgi:hypothetical protein